MIVGGEGEEERRGRHSLGDAVSTTTTTSSGMKRRRIKGIKDLMDMCVVEVEVEEVTTRKIGMGKTLYRDHHRHLYHKQTDTERGG